MRTLRNIVPNANGVSYGARIVDDKQEERDYSPLRHADEQNLQWAANYWPQSTEDDFDWELGRMQVRRRADGEILKIRLGVPMEELASDIVTFVVRDGRIVLLGKPGAETVRTGYWGTLTSRKIRGDDQWSPPEEGQIW
jgi:hypothetical protein